MTIVHTTCRRRLLSAVILAPLLITLFYLICLIHPKWLPFYHPFHPNYSHLSRAYDGWSIGKSLSSLKQHLFGSASEIEGWYIKFHLPENHPNCQSLSTASISSDQSFNAPICDFSLVFLSYLDPNPSQSISGIQFYDATNYKSHFYQRPIESFHSSQLPSYTDFFQLTKNASTNHPVTPFNNMTISIDSNTMSMSSISFHESPRSGDDASAQIHLHASFQPSPSLPSMPQPYFFNPTSHTVGMLGFLPLSCFQQMIVMKLDVQTGSIILDGQRTDISGAEAYLEKTWGMSFPKEYLWMHATRFKSQIDSDIVSANDDQSSLIHSLFFSLAVVPVVGPLRIPGFVSTLVFNGTYMHFATQLGSSISVEHSDDAQVLIRTYDATFEHELTIQLDRHLEIDRRNSSWLYAAKDGRMQKIIRQQVGKDLCTVTLTRLVKTDHTHTSSHSDEFVRHGYERHVLARAQTRSIGLEVMIEPNGPLVKLADELYSSIRPWSSGWFQLNTPIISLSLSSAFVTVGVRMIDEAMRHLYLKISLALIALASSAWFVVGRGSNKQKTV